MLTGALRNRIDAVWNAFWAGGIANPLEVIEQITYLLFISGLDDVQLREERKASMLKRPMERVIFPEGKDSRGRPYQDLRWITESPFSLLIMATRLLSLSIGTRVRYEP